VFLRRIFISAAFACFLPACTTTGNNGQSPVVTPAPPVIAGGGDAGATPSSDSPSPANPDPAPEDTPSPSEGLPQEFQALSGWQSANPGPALFAFRRACATWAVRDSSTALGSNLPEYGKLSDWENACFAADYAGDDSASARRFFEQYFLPVNRSIEQGLLTGYYEPEIMVRSMADAVYREPILTRPADPNMQNLPRSQIRPSASTVIGYGKPIDVFFMQVQGSGRIVFEDGRSVRAAFAGHNSQGYKSIGAALIARGEMTKDQASKQSIEAWMEANGPTATRALINENPRYIFFEAQAITPGEGPRGSMGAPLEAMATIAVDNAYHPYGTLAWLDTTLPQVGGDYIGAPASFLVNVQDSGGAIKGPLRADLYFGSGFEAGAKAGVMKHPVTWTLFLPTALALRYLAIS
jgi:membrane-bound lytic murein transglycosylase A